MNELRERNRAVWSAGDWDQVANLISEIGPELIELTDIGDSTKVLDVGAGSGSNISIPAAQRGADVVAVDLTDAWFDAGRERAAKAGVDVEWVVGDAEELPFEDASFDRVLSTFGHMFAPHHDQAAAELVRVTRPGGTIGFATWLPTGYGGQLFKAIGEFMPPPPEGVSPPPLWGDRDYVTERFEPHGLAPTFTTGTIHYDFLTEQEFVEFFESNFGPFVMAKPAIGDRWNELHERFEEIVSEQNENTDGTAKLRAEYLLTVIPRS